MNGLHSFCVIGLAIYVYSRFERPTARPAAKHQKQRQHNSSVISPSCFSEAPRGTGDTLFTFEPTKAAIGGGAHELILVLHTNAPPPPRLSAQIDFTPASGELRTNPIIINWPRPACAQRVRRAFNHRHLRGPAIDGGKLQFFSLRRLYDVFFFFFFFRSMCVEAGARE